MSGQIKTVLSLINLVQQLILFSLKPRMQGHSRAKSNDYKNKSMVSTQHMSCNQSHATNFFYDNAKPNNKSLLLEYANLPYKKIPPRWNQSAATWRHTSHRYSFSKDSRFKDYKVVYTDILKPEIPTTRSQKSCTFGKGRRRPISEIVLRNAKQKPSPDRYNMEVFDESTRLRTKGKSFGIGWNSYEKNFIDHRKDVYSPFQNQQNPSAKYEVRQKPGKNKQKFTMYGRLKMYTQKMADSKNGVPGAKYNIKDRHLFNEVGLHERNFSFGERMDLSMPANDYPGPIYMIPGFCAKFTKIQKKLQRSLPQELKTQD